MSAPKDGAPDGNRGSAGSGPPPGVGDRLEILRSRHIAQRVNDAARPEEGSPRLSSRALSILVAARLRELRALDELARYLHRGTAAAAPRRPPTGDPLD